MNKKIIQIKNIKFLVVLGFEPNTTLLKPNALPTESCTLNYYICNHANYLINNRIRLVLFIFRKIYKLE